MYKWRESRASSLTVKKTHILTLLIHFLPLLENWWFSLTNLHSGKKSLFKQKICFTLSVFYHNSCSSMWLNQFHNSPNSFLCSASAGFFFNVHQAAVLHKMCYSAPYSATITRRHWWRNDQSFYHDSVWFCIITTTYSTCGFNEQNICWLWKQQTGENMRLDGLNFFHLKEEFQEIKPVCNLCFFTNPSRDHRVFFSAINIELFGRVTSGCKIMIWSPLQSSSF